MAKLDQYKDHFILMGEAGFIAVNQGDEDAALKLFKASEMLNPNSILAKVGFGYIHLCKLELKQAAKSFEDLLAKEPDNELARTFLGLCLSLNPTECAKGEKVLEESLKDAKDPMIKGLAKSSLEFVERFVKKPPAPGQASPGQAKGKKKK